MSHGTCATVVVQGQPSEGNPSGQTVINESDFDAATMTLAKPADPVNPVDPVDPVDPVALLEPVIAPKVVAPWAAN